METTLPRKLLEDTAGLYNCTVDTDCEQVLALEYCWRCVYTLSPPPSLPPPPPDHHNIAQITPYLVSAVCALGVAFLILTTCAILLRCRLSRRRNSLNSSSSGDSVFLDEDHGPVDHPIWRIVTVGLPQSVIDSITTVNYKKGDGLIEGTDCSVCLTEFEEGDDLRLLPKCSHAFHINCIDTWLRSHKNCPLCRSPVINHSSTRLNTNLSDRRSSGSVRFQNPETDESQETEMDQWRIRDHVEGIRIGEILKNDWGKRAFSDLGANHRFIIEDLQSVRRSISMDACAMNKSVAVNVAKPSGEGSSKEESQDSRFSRLMKSYSIGRSLQKAPVSMKRSFSSRIRRSKSHSSSILPL